MSDYTEPSKASGQFHSMKGSAVEVVGNMMGSESWQQSGSKEHAAGETEYKAAQAKGYAEGTMDRMAGKKDAVMGAVMGDRSQEVAGNARQDKGQMQQNVNSSA